MVRNGDQPDGFGPSYSEGIYISSVIERVSLVGHNRAADLAIYSGGPVYEGGAGTAVNTFVADFRQYAKDIPGGVPLDAPESSSVGTSIVKGFERFVVDGTNRGDDITGGPGGQQISARRKR